jgi:type IV pilus assembly protein PilV
MLVKRVRGVSLVEVLVALVVLSVGLLGIAALLVQSVQGSRSALFRTEAVNLVSDMADRIRANANGGAAYAGAGALTTCQAIKDNEGTNCSMAELAADDVERWRRAVRNTFPRVSDAIPSATVQHFAGSPERYQITVAWQESQGAAAPSQYSYSTDVVLLPRAAP